MVSNSAPDFRIPSGWPISRATGRYVPGVSAVPKSSVPFAPARAENTPLKTAQIVN